MNSKQQKVLSGSGQSFHKVFGTQTPSSMF
jgi:hypothetical protein